MDKATTAVVAGTTSVLGRATAEAITCTNRTLEAAGFLTGPVDLDEPVTWGPARFWTQDGRVHFEVVVDVAGRRDEDMEALLELVGPAVQAAVAAACGAAVEADVSGWSYPAGELRAVGTTLALCWEVHVTLDTAADAAPRGQAALEAVLEGADHRLPALYEVYLLGLRAVQTIAPVVGLWAFTTVLEEESRRGNHNLKHVVALAEELRAEGHALPEEPARGPDQIRAAALHPTPKDPLPTAEEVTWFRELAGAYLLRRASRRSGGRSSGR